MRNDLDAIQARADAADPGPWFVTGAKPEDDGVWIDAVGCRVTCDREGEAHRHTRVLLMPNPNFPVATNIAFAAAARQDVPALVAEVRELRATRDDLIAAYRKLLEFARAWEPLTPGDLSDVRNAVARAEQRHPEPVDPLKARPQRVRDAVERHSGFAPPPSDPFPPNEFRATDEDVPF